MARYTFGGDIHDLVTRVDGDDLGALKVAPGVAVQFYATAVGGLPVTDYLVDTNGDGLFNAATSAVTTMGTGYLPDFRGPDGLDTLYYDPDPSDADVRRVQMRARDYSRGSSAYDIAVENGFVGTETEWLASLASDVPGPSGGDSAYTIAVQNGYTGTQLQWLASLVGPEGASAYEVAVENGFTGTVSQWLASLVGPTGPQGPAGADGTGGGTGGGVIFYDIDTDMYPALTPGSIFVGPAKPQVSAEEAAVDGLYVYMSRADLGEVVEEPPPDPEPSTDLFNEPFDGTAGAAWDAALWTAGASGGTAVENGDTTGTITRTTGRFGIRFATAINQDHELLVPFQFGTVTPAPASLQIVMRGDANMNALRGYSVEPLVGTSTFVFTRIGTETAETTGGTAPHTFTLPFPISAGTRYQLRMATVTEASRVLIRVKIWPVLQPEPAGWSAVFSDATVGRLTSHRNDGFTVNGGGSGLTFLFGAPVRAILPTTTNTNPTPITIAPPVVNPPPPDPEPTTGPWGSEDIGWLTGASGNNASNGNFATWRGRPLGIVGTWNDSASAHTAQWSLEAYNHWPGNVDNAIGAIFGGESWGAAANGAYDSRWVTALKKANSLRVGKPGVMYIRFAHEFNGTWYDWRVRPGQEGDFVRAWRRFHGLFKSHCDSRHKLTYSPNWDNVIGCNMPACWPGDAYVDVIAPDYYNQWPYNNTTSGWWSTMNTGTVTNPKGLEKWRLFAEAHGKPVGLAEWGDKAFDGGSSSGGGDSPNFMTNMWNWYNDHKPAKGVVAGPGQVQYDIYFNVENFGSGQFRIYPETSMPIAAATYASLWKR